MDEDIFERLKRIIVEQLGCKESEITLDAHFADDLGADSLDIIEMIMAVEDEFNIQISEDEAEGLERVSDVIRYIEEHK